MEDAWLTATYFEWLSQEAFETDQERRNYEGVLRALHDIPFYWTNYTDENRAGDALAFRQSDFLSFQTGLNRLDQFWLADWACSQPSVLEVLLAMARRWSFYYEIHKPAFYFNHMFTNMKYNLFPGKVLTSKGLEQIRQLTDEWLSRQFQSNGVGSPWPVHLAFNVFDIRTMDMWSAMNAYSAEHFQ